MNLIAQASEGVSLFLHPDYISAARYIGIDLFDGIFTFGDLCFIIILAAIALIVGILIAYLISVIKNRSYYK